MPQQEQQFKYVRLPNGKYGKFAADATTEYMRAAVLKMFPDAYNQKITDPNTIGPQRPATPTPTSELSTGGVIKRYSGLEGLGAAQDKLVSLLPDSVKELLFGGQAAGKPLGTRSGVANNPVTVAMSMAPGAASTLGELGQAPGQIFQRLLRGPGGVGDIEGIPSFLKRELELRVPRNPSPMVRSEMYNELGQARVQRGAEQEALDKAQQLTSRKSELTARKQLESVEKMIKEEIEKHRGFAEGKGGPSNLLSSSPNRPSAVEGGGAAGGGAVPGAPGGGQDLISRTRALVKPGETPTAADLKRAGDLTQAPIARLRTLSKFGDKLAENEINRRLQNTALGAVGPLTAAVPHLANDGSVRYAGTSTQQISPMQGFGVQGANIESPSGKKISYFASAGSPKPPKSGTLGEMAYDDKKGNILAWNGSKWVQADDANRQEIRTKISDERAHLVGEYYTGGHLTKDQVMIFAKQGLIGTKDARRIVNGPQEERAQ